MGWKADSSYLSPAVFLWWHSNFPVQVEGHCCSKQRVSYHPVNYCLPLFMLCHFEIQFFFSNFEMSETHGCEFVKNERRIEDIHQHTKGMFLSSNGLLIYCTMILLLTLYFCGWV